MDAALAAPSNRARAHGRTGLALMVALAALTPGDAPRAERPRVYAIREARIVIAPGKELASGTVVVRDGTIEAVGAAATVPPDAEIIEGKGLTVYPGLIDPFTRLGLPRAPEAPPEQGRQARSVEKADEPGPGRPNTQIRSDTRAALIYQAPAATDLEKMRKQGFTSALVVPDRGVFRGTSALVHLAPGDPSRAAIASDVGSHLAFETAQGSVYPASLMGVIALVRQTFEDARRHAAWKERWRKNPAGMERPPISPTLDAAGDVLAGRARAFFEADDTHAFSRIAAISREFSIAPVVVGNGYEYEVLDDLKRSAFPLILPVAFPDPPHMDDEDASLDVTTRDLKRWERAPGNLAAVSGAGIRFALTSYRLKNAGDFRKKVAKAIEKGLSRDAALEAVTVTPARLLGVDAILGTVEAGKIADLVLADGDLFAEKTQIKKVFIDGTPIEIEEESKDFDPNAKVDPRGTWELSYAMGRQAVTRVWTIEGSAGSYTGTAETQSGKVTLADLSLTGNRLTGSYTAGSYGTVEFTLIIKGEDLSGSLSLPNGSKVSTSGTRTAKPEGGIL